MAGMAKTGVATASLWLVLTSALLAQSRRGPEFLVNTYTTTHRLPAAPARVRVDTGGGGWVVVWEHWQDPGYPKDGMGIFGQRFSAAGVRLGPEFRVSTYTVDAQYYPDVAVAPDGDFVVVWSSNTQDGSGYGIFGQRFASDGSQLGGEFAVNAYTTGHQLRPSVESDAAGNLVVVWGSGAPRPGVFGQRFDAGGAPTGAEFQIDTLATIGFVTPRVSRNDGGGFVVVWSDDPVTGNATEVFARRFDASGQGLGAEFVVNSYTTGQQGAADVVMDDLGGFAVSWSSHATGDAGLRVRRFSSVGSPLGSEVSVAAALATASGPASLAPDDNGGFVIAWGVPRPDPNQDENHIVGQRFASDGARRGPEFRINKGGGRHVRPVVSMNGDDMLAVWAQEGFNLSVGLGIGIFAQLFDGGPGDRAGKALDFHADARSDLVWYNRSTGQTYLWRMNGGTATAFNAITTVPDLDWSIVAGGDFGGDGRADLVWQNRTTGQVYLWQMNGATPTSTTPIATVGELDWQIQATGDTGGDGKADLIWQNRSTGAVYVWRMSGSAILSTLPVATVPDLNWRIVAARDFGADGRSDLVWWNASTGQVYLWQMNGASMRPAFVETLENLDWRVVAGADFTGDARSDLVTQNQATGAVRLWTMNGATITSTAAIATVPDLDWRVVASGDFDGNGRADLLWYHRATGQTYVWLMNGASIASVSLVSTVGDLNWTPQALH
jgi:hypothetical protein